MTDFGEWDKFVAALSDSDGEGGAAAGEEAGEGRAGAGKAAAPRPKAANGMGNALDRHNARHADAPQEVPLGSVSWKDRGGEVVLRLPLGAASRERVACTFSRRSLELRLGARAGGGAETRVLHIKRLQHAIEPERCAFEVYSAGAGDAASEDEVRVTLAKADAARAWEGLAAEAGSKGGRSAPPSPRSAARAAPPTAISSYSWLDLDSGARIFLNVPGIDAIPREDIAVTFRDRSLDVEVLDASARKRYTMAITELPDTIVVPQCNWKVKGGQLVLYVRKWAKIGWSKLQMKR